MLVHGKWTVGQFEWHRDYNWIITVSGKYAWGGFLFEGVYFFGFFISKKFFKILEEKKDEKKNGKYVSGSGNGNSHGIRMW